MKYYAGLDVSLEETSICIMDGDGTLITERKVASQPEAIAEMLGSLGLRLHRVGLEVGPLSPWLHSGLRAAGFNAICIETRQAKAALKAMRNKTDRNDARGIAQMMRTGWLRKVHVKRPKTRELRLLLVNRRALVTERCEFENTIRGTLKVFGLKVGIVSCLRFEARFWTLN